MIDTNIKCVIIEYDNCKRIKQCVVEYGHEIVNYYQNDGLLLNAVKFLLDNKVRDIKNYPNGDRKYYYY